MLLGNRSVIHKSPFRRFSGTTLSGDRSNFGGNGALRDRFTDGLDDLSGGIPCGHLAPSSWSLPQKSGGMSAFTTCAGTGEISLSMAAGIGIDAQADGVAVATSDIVGVLSGHALMAGASASSALIMGVGSIAGQTAGYGMATGAVFAAISIAGAAHGIADAYAVGILSMSSPALSVGSSIANGALAALYTLAGVSLGEGAASADLVGAYGIGGAANGIAVVAGGGIIGFGHLHGAVIGDGDLVANPYAHGSMNGSTNSASGELTADAVAAAVWRYTR